MTLGEWKRKNKVKAWAEAPLSHHTQWFAYVYKKGSYNPTYPGKTELLACQELAKVYGLKWPEELK